MPDKIFIKNLAEDNIPPESVIDISNDGRILIVSDIHMGYGSRDDLAKNGEMVISILENYYYKNGWILVLNGDIEELQKFSLENIKKRWIDLYRVFDLFNNEKRLYKIIGNHDELLNIKDYKDYPYHIHEVVKINTGSSPAYIFHGHQLSKIYSKFNKIFGFLIKSFLKPLGIMNISDSRSPTKKFKIEKKAYSFSLDNKCMTIIGHTHRPLFESLSRFDFIKFEIERLCQKYPETQDGEKEFIETEIRALRKDLINLKLKEMRDVIKQNLYGDELPVPCLFNSGCTIGKKGINAIEVTKEEISLIYWFEEGKCKKFIQRGRYKMDGIPDQPYHRVVLNHNRLDYISAKIKLLGN